MIYLLLADGFEEAEALVPLDLLRRANLAVKTVGITGKVVTGSHGIPVTADLLPDAIGDFDAVILPGGMPGTKNLDASPVVDALLKKAVANSAVIGAICAAPSVLGHRGLLSGKRAVCFPGFENELSGAIPSKRRVEIDGRFVTAVGMGAAYEFGLALVSVLSGADVAKSLAKSALIPSVLCE